MSEERLARLRDLIRDVPDFPKPGIMFKDITPLLSDPRGFTTSLDLLAEAYADTPLDAIVGIESRGFIFGAALAARMTASFVPVRKPGKLPADTDRIEYSLEYGTDALEMHKNSLKDGWKVLIVDDLLATGGTARATIDLCRRQGGSIVGTAFVIELEFLGGRKKLDGVRVESLLTY